MSGGGQREAHATTRAMPGPTRRGRLRVLLLGAIGLLYLLSIKNSTCYKQEMQR